MMNIEQELFNSQGALTLEQPGDQNIILSHFSNTDLFSVEVSINPLVGAAQPLLSIIQRLNLTKTVHKPMDLKKQIEHEFNLFGSKASNADYTQEIILVARYLLASVLDEMFCKLEWQSINDYLCIGRFTPKSKDNIESDERFFIILEKMLENPNDHLELLELAYLCLSFGFEGKYREHANKREQLDFVLDKLYDLVKRERADDRKHLLISATQLREQRSGLKSLSITSLVLAVILVVGLSFAGFNLLLGKEISENASQLAQNSKITETVKHG